jgi:hypothetical protein
VPVSAKGWDETREEGTREMRKGPGKNIMAAASLPGRRFIIPIKCLRQTGRTDDLGREALEARRVNEVENGGVQASSSVSASGECV